MFKPSRAFSYYPRLRKLKSYVEAHMNERITLADVARVVSLEPKYFSAFFREKTGTTFSSWLTTIRIERAKKMLRTENVLIGDVAKSVGYKNMRSFQRSFKRHTGVTPSEYRRGSRDAL